MTTEDLDGIDGLHALGDDDLPGRLRAVLGPRWAIAEAGAGPAAPPGGDGAPRGGAGDVAADRVEAAVAVLEALLGLGWATPEGLVELLAHGSAAAVGEGVRSLAEDLAVVRARARTASERSRGQLARARRAVERSEELAAEASRRLRESQDARAGSTAGGTAGDAELLREVQHLRTALSNRPRIEHAVGIVMLVLGTDEETAFRALSALSQHTNVKLRDLCGVLADQVGRGQGLPDDVVRALRVVADGGRLGSARGPRRYR